MNKVLATWTQGFTEQGKCCVWLNGLHERDDPNDNMGPISTWIDCNNEETAALVARAPEMLVEIEKLKEQRDELLEALQLIYSWANNWDSEFMNDPEWREKDFPKIHAAIFKAASK